MGQYAQREMNSIPKTNQDCDSSEEHLPSKREKRELRHRSLTKIGPTALSRGGDIYIPNVSWGKQRNKRGHVPAPMSELNDPG